jgi:hypothetical protein
MLNENVPSGLQARKANENAVVAEKRKQQRGDKEGEDGDRQGSKRKWYEEKQKRKVGGPGLGPGSFRALKYSCSWRQAEVLLGPCLGGSSCWPGSFKQQGPA